MRYLSLCSGIESASFAWAPLGWTPVAFSEIEPFPCAVLAHRFPHVPNVGSMLDIDGKKYRGKIDMIVGGTPCQAFSIAGKRESLDDDRGNLTLKFAEICNDARPDFIVWENVPGVLSTRDNAFGCLLASLVGETVPLEPAGQKWTHAGYVLGPKRAVAWRLLDAQYFGLAQRRLRLFLVGCPRDRADPREILFEPEGMRGDSPPSRETGEGVAGSISARAGRSGGRAGADENDAAGYLQPVVTPAVPRWPAEVAPTLNAHFGEKQGLEDQHALGGAGLFVPAVSHAPTGEGFDASEDGTGRGTPIVPVQMFRCSECGDVFHDPYGEIDTLSPPECGRCGNDENNTLAGDDDGQPPVIGFHGSQDPDVYGPVSGPVGRNQGAETCVAFDTNQITHPANRSNPKPNGPSPDLCRWGQPPAVATQYAVRRLTPRECERLQGFPDDWTLIPWRGKPAEQCPDGPRYKAIGNSKATRVVHWIGCRIQRVRERAERDLLASILQ